MYETKEEQDIIYPFYIYTPLSTITVRHMQITEWSTFPPKNDQTSANHISIHPSQKVQFKNRNLITNFG